MSNDAHLTINTHKNSLFEAIQKFKSIRNLHEIDFLHDLHENTQENSTPSSEDDQSPDCQESHPDQDLEPPMDDLLDFINNQHHSDAQLDQILQTYQIYTECQSPTRQVNAHITYHVAQANQAKHGPFVDRGANGGLGGSGVRVLNTSSRHHFSYVNHPSRSSFPFLDMMSSCLVRSVCGIRLCD